MRPYALAPDLLPQPLVAGDLERAIQRQLVVAAVVGRADGGRVGELVRLDEIPPPDFDRVEAEGPAYLFDCALSDEARLRPARAAVGPVGEVLV